MNKEPCPHCGWETTHLDIHQPTCERVPVNIGEEFLNGKRTLSQLGRKYGVSGDFIRRQMRRRGVTAKQVHEHLQEITENGHAGGKPPGNDKPVVRPPDDQCVGCCVVLWNDPAYIPDAWASHAHWHVNFGGYCFRCLRDVAGIVWEENVGLLKRTGENYNKVNGY